MKEEFLIYINGMLTSGWIPDLFVKEDMDSIYSGLRSEAKAQGILDTPEALTELFISRIKANLHVVLCFSLGDTFRLRARRFPGIINCTVIDCKFCAKFRYESRN